MFIHQILQGLCGHKIRAKHAVRQVKFRIKKILKYLQYRARSDAGHFFSSSAEGQPIDVLLVIASHKRNEILLKNINKFYQAQNDNLNLSVLVCLSKDEELDMLEQKLGNRFPIHLVKCANRPLGNKWQVAINHARSLTPKSVFILGSDDFVSPEYLTRAYDIICLQKKADMYGSKRWFLQTSEGGFLSAMYLNNEQQKNNCLGAGRLYSSDFLDENNWVLFEKYFDSGLDDYGLKKVLSHGRKGIYFDDSDGFVLSVKGNWKMLNSLNLIMKSKRVVIDAVDSGCDLAKRLEKVAN